ncbi:MAG: hypothetical protein NTW52_07420 [Planctomycetota bacterium]|nr:hypothetical protein [Planctomycetota bacterium]
MDRSCALALQARKANKGLVFKRKDLAITVNVYRRFRVVTSADVDIDSDALGGLDQFFTSVQYQLVLPYYKG